MKSLVLKKLIRVHRIHDNDRYNRLYNDQCKTANGAKIVMESDLKNTSAIME